MINILNLLIACNFNENKYLINPEFKIYYTDPELQWCVYNSFDQNIYLFIYPYPGLPKQERIFIYFESKKIVLTTIIPELTNFQYPSYQTIPYSVFVLNSKEKICEKFNLKDYPFNSPIKGVNRTNKIYSKNYWVSTKENELSVMPLQNSEIIMEIGWLNEIDFLKNKMILPSKYKNIIGLSHASYFHPNIIRSNTLNLKD